MWMKLLLLLVCTLQQCASAPACNDTAPTATCMTFLNDNECGQPFNQVLCPLTCTNCSAPPAPPTAPTTATVATTATTPATATTGTTVTTATIATMATTTAGSCSDVAPTALCQSLSGYRLSGIENSQDEDDEDDDDDDDEDEDDEMEVQQHGGRGRRRGYRFCSIFGSVWCRLTCGFCTNMTTTAPPITVTPACSDLDSRCSQLGRRQCRRFSYVRRNCRSTCGLCCSDISSRCNPYSCSRHSELRGLCQSCGLCTCSDISSRCAANARRCNSSAFVRGRCHRTCGVCT